MRCYSVLLVGELSYHLPDDGSVERPKGYTVIRYVVAGTEEEARQRAVAKELKLLASDWPELRDGQASVKFDETEVEVVPFKHLLRRRYGRAYYMAD